MIDRMPANRYLITAAAMNVPVEGTKFFFDANVWLFIDGPFFNPGHHKTRIYSAFLSSVLKGGGSIVMDSLVLAEFVHRFIRDNHNYLKDQGQVPAEFKAFRGCAEYAMVADELADVLFHMLKDVERVNDDFAHIDMDACINQFGARKADFNDVMYWKICADNGYHFVTDDGDCHFPDIPIVTANARLARAAH